MKTARGCIAAIKAALDTLDAPGGMAAMPTWAATCARRFWNANRYAPVGEAEEAA